MRITKLFLLALVASLLLALSAPAAQAALIRVEPFMQCGNQQVHGYFDYDNTTGNGTPDGSFVVDGGLVNQSTNLTALAFFQNPKNGQVLYATVTPGQSATWTIPRSWGNMLIGDFNVGIGC